MLFQLFGMTSMSNLDILEDLVEGTGSQLETVSNSNKNSIIIYIESQSKEQAVLLLNKINQRLGRGTVKINTSGRSVSSITSELNIDPASLLHYMNKEEEMMNRRNEIKENRLFERKHGKVPENEFDEFLENFNQERGI